MTALLEKGANVNTQVERYRSVLHAVVANGHYEIVQLLLKKGADVNTQYGEYGKILQVASV